MKIYASQHDVKEVSKVELRDIPLAYIDTSSTEQFISIAREPIFNGSEGIIRAYEEFDSPEAYFFDENNEIIKSLMLKRLGNRYVYEPQNAVEFTPLRFSFHALVKKNMTFRNDKHYNLKVAVHEEAADLAFSKQLIAVFGDAPRRRLCPPNISINDCGMTPETLINASFIGNDFMFIKSPDGTHYKEIVTTTTEETVAAATPAKTTSTTDVNGDTSTTTTVTIALKGTDKVKTTTVVATSLRVLDMDTLLSSNTNAWLSVETFGSLIKTKNNSNFRLKAPTLYKTTDYSIKDYVHYFDEGEHPGYPAASYTYSYPFEDGAALILEKANGGFVVVTHKTFFDNLHENVNLLYELMMQVFLKSYYRTKEVSSWITDQPVDFIAYKRSKYNLQHAELNLSDLLKNDNYDIGNEFTLLAVNTSSPDVIFLNMNAAKDMLFYKISTNPDPAKNDGDISIYTSKHSVIHYRQEVIKKIESGLDISTEINDTGLYITIHPCHSTQNRIHTRQDQTLRIEDPRKEYVLVCKPGTTDIENDFVLIPVNDFTASDGLKVAAIRVVNNPAAKAFNIRVNGGGLPLDSEPDYSMLDIGHVNGRPYRVGATMVIRLPSRLKEHDTKIRDAIGKHAASGDYPLIVYE